MVTISLLVIFGIPFAVTAITSLALYLVTVCAEDDWFVPSTSAVAGALFSYLMMVIIAALLVLRVYLV